MRELPGHGLVFDGHLDLDDAAFDAALNETRAWLIAGGMSIREATHRTTWTPGLSGYAWWGDDERGFVQEHHDGATPVTIIHVPIPEADAT